MVNPVTGSLKVMVTVDTGDGVGLLTATMVATGAMAFTVQV